MTTSFSAQQADPIEEAFAVVELFKAAFAASDPERIVRLFTPDALFIGTVSERQLRGHAEILAYFQRSAAANLPKTIEIERYQSMVLSDGAVLFSGEDVFTRTVDGKAVHNPARFTFILTKGAEGWRFAHFHSSRRP